MDKLEELEATITQLQQEHDRLKNEDLDTTDTRTVPRKRQQKGTKIPKHKQPRQRLLIAAIKKHPMP
jgi:hypothetical protein